VGLLLSLTLAAGLPGEILDRTVAVVGNKPITATEVDLQLLLQSMFNEATPDLSPEARRKALERLVEQQLMETDMTLAGLQVVENRELDAAFAELRAGRFAGLGFDAALTRYGLKERDVRDFLRKQLRFTRYVQFRFRAGLQAGEDAIKAAYNRRYAGSGDPPPLDDVREELREEILNQRSEAMLDERVRQLRVETRVAFLDPIAPNREGEP
jgi:hypothetical protein